MLVTITINNWQKFNPRADRGNFAWFRLQNAFFLDQSVFCLNSDAKLIFIFMCCEASRKNSATFQLHTDYVAPLVGMNVKKIIKEINHLTFSKILSSSFEEPLKKSSRISLPSNVTGRNVTEQKTSAEASADTTEPPKIEEPTLVPKVDQSTRVTRVSPRGAIPELSFFDPEAKTLLEGVSHDAQKAWLAAYKDPEWISQEVLKANAWIKSNPKRAPKQFAKFMANWLSRAHEDHRKKIPSNRTANVPPITRMTEEQKQIKTQEMTDKFLEMARRGT